MAKKHQNVKKPSLLSEKLAKMYDSKSSFPQSINKEFSNGEEFEGFFQKIVEISTQFGLTNCYYFSDLEGNDYTLLSKSKILEEIFRQDINSGMQVRLWKDIERNAWFVELAE